MSPPLSFFPNKNHPGLMLGWSFLCIEWLLFQFSQLRSFFSETVSKEFNLNV